ncbi:19199_t:CDS:2, partial [Gigaspora rosea]
TTYLAYNLTKRLQEQQGKNADDDRNLKCVTLAADLDMDHIVIYFIKECLGIGWKQEEGSITMFEDFLNKNLIDLDSIGLKKPDDVEIIKALIKVRAIDHMICDVLKQAKQYVEKKFEVESFKILINAGEKYMRLSDSIFYEIEQSKEIIRKIKKRKLYKFIDECLTEKNEDNDKKNINKQILDEVINCVENVDCNDQFLIKKIKKVDVSYFLPKVYKEEIVQIYLRTKENDEKDELKTKISAAFRRKTKDLNLIKEEEESNSEIEEDNDNSDGAEKNVKKMKKLKDLVLLMKHLSERK